MMAQPFSLFGSINAQRWIKYVVRRFFEGVAEPLPCGFQVVFHPAMSSALPTTRCHRSQHCSLACRVRDTDGMQGLILEGTTEDSVRLSAEVELAHTDLAPRQVRVEIKAAGVCGSDLSCVHGKYYMPTPLVPRARSRWCGCGDGSRGHLLRGWRPCHLVDLQQLRSLR